MKPRKWTLEKLLEEALKYNSKRTFELGNNGAYQTTRNRNLESIFFNHMPKDSRVGQKPHNFIWDFKNIQQEALKYQKLSDFRKNSRPAYKAALRNNILNKVTGHMIRKRGKWSFDELCQEALQYKTRKDFHKNNPGAYSAAHKSKNLDNICIHMIQPGISSNPEKELFDILKVNKKEIKKLRLRKIFVENKPHIKGFDLDIYDPLLNKGIEFDGRYWHTVAGLKTGREHWPISDLNNYHQIKDDYFASKGITILHIREEDWLKNKKNCIEKCLNFLKS